MVHSCFRSLGFAPALQTLIPLPLVSDTAAGKPLPNRVHGDEGSVPCAIFARKDTAAVTCPATR